MPKEDSNMLFSSSIVKNPPPPSYTNSFFDDATIYAQIDHNSVGSSTLCGGQILRNNSLQNVDRKFINDSQSQLLAEHDPQSQLNPVTSQLPHTTSSTNSQNLVSSNNKSSLNNSDIIGLASSSQTATFSSISANQFPNSSFQTLSLSNSNNKQFLHDIVVTRCPLSFSEQESCV